MLIGEDFRESDDPESPYLSLKDSRATARRLEREAASSDDPDSAPLSVALREWEDIETLADRILRTQSKDLEIACWYCEALVRLNGFGGLAGGLELLARLIEEYWDQGLYPKEDEDGVDTRLAPLSGLIGRGVDSSLVQPIKLIPLSDRTDGPPTALWKIELAFAPSRGETRESAEKKVTQVEAALSAVTRSTPAFLKTTRREVDRCLMNLDRLMKAVDDKSHVGGFASQVSTPLKAIAQLLDDHAGHLFVEAPAPDLAETDERVDGSAGEAHAPGSSPAAKAAPGPFGREDAIKALEKAADYFEKAEPQALVSASIRDVIRRANLPVMDLLAELIPDGNVRREFLLRSGIKYRDE